MKSRKEGGPTLVGSFDLKKSQRRGQSRLINEYQRSRNTYCVFNKTRESFLSLNVAAADTHFARLKGLLGRMKLKSDEGIWVLPSQGVHTIGVLFAIDLVYLDGDRRVIHLVESLGSFRIAPIRTRCSSVLELPTRTIYSSQTQIGDRLLICSPAEMERYLGQREDKGAQAAST